MRIEIGVGGVGSWETVRLGFLKGLLTGEEVLNMLLGAIINTSTSNDPVATRVTHAMRGLFGLGVELRREVDVHFDGAVIAEEVTTKTTVVREAALDGTFLTSDVILQILPLGRSKHTSNAI